MSLALIYWFSGSGNARRLAGRVAERFRAAGHETRLVPVEEGILDPAHGDAGWVGLVTAVYGFGLPERVAAFLARLPTGGGRRAFVLTAIGNEETLELGPLRFPVPPTEGIANLDAEGRLARLGYDVVRGGTVAMPNSWFLPCDTPAPDACAALLSAADGAADRFADAALALERGRADFRPASHLPLGLLHLLYLHLGRRHLGKCFVASPACTGCAACAKGCPAGAIAMEGGRPRWNFDCQGCFRCANRCPAAAIDVSGTALFGSLAFAWLGARLLRPLLGRRRSRLFLELVSFAISFPLMSLLHDAVNGRGPLPLPPWPFTRGRRRYTAGAESSPPVL